MRLAIVGTGYVGLVTGTCLSEVGHDVVCVDVNERKIELLRDGRSPIFEPGLEEMIRRNLDHERLSFTSDLPSALEGAKVVFIAVGTPEGEDGSADLTYVVEVARSISQCAKKEILVLVKSTVPVGTCDLVDQEIRSGLKKRGVNFKIHVASNPEFLKEGAAVDDFMRPDRIIVGLDDNFGRPLIEDIYRPFITDDPAKLLIMDRRSSELSKYGANAMLATRISFMNELSRLCEQVGANIDAVRQGMGADPRIGNRFLHPGPGYGGSCFPKDVEALITSGNKNGVQLKVLEAVSQANRHQREHVAQFMKRYFKELKGKRIGVWGLSFKPGTDDVRETPSQPIIRNLLSWGAEVIAHDPEAAKNFSSMVGQVPGLSYADEAYDVANGADALILVTEWPEYKRPNWEKIARIMRNKAVFDLRNQYNGSDLVEAGFYYQCVGKPVVSKRI